MRVRNPGSPQVSGDQLRGFSGIGIAHGQIHLGGIFFCQGQNVHGLHLVPGGLDFSGDGVVRQLDRRIVGYRQCSQSRQRTEGLLIEIRLSVFLLDKGEKQRAARIAEGAVAIIDKNLIGNGGIIEAVQRQMPVGADRAPVLNGGGAVPAAVGRECRRHGGGRGGRQGGDGLVHRDTLRSQCVDQQPGSGQFIVSRGATGGDDGCGHVVFGNHNQSCMVIQCVAAFYQGLDTALGEGEPLHCVPAQAEGERVQRVLRPDSAAVLGVGHGVQRGLAEKGGVRQSSAEGDQIGGGGVHPAGTHGVQAVPGQSPGIGALIDTGQTVRIKIAGRCKGAFQVRRLQNVTIHIVHEVHSADRFHHQLCQGEAVVAVDAVCAGVCLEPLGGKPLQQLVRGRGVGVIKEQGAVKSGAHQPGGVVEQHPHGDVPVPGIGHFEILQISGHRCVQGQLPILCQLHHCHCGVNLADRADSVQIRVHQNAVFRLGERAGMAGEHNLSVLPQGVLDTDGTSQSGGSLCRSLGG